MHLAKLTFRFFVRYKERVGSIRRELQGAKSMAEDYRVRKKKCHLTAIILAYCWHRLMLFYKFKLLVKTFTI